MNELNDIPSAKKYERAVLGSMLWDISAVEIAIERLEPSCFYDPNNEMIFNAMCELYEKNSGIDSLTIEAVLINKGQLEQVGGSVFIAGINLETNSAANANWYCDVLVEYNERRKLLLLGKNLVSLAADDSEKSEDIMEKIQNNLNKIGGKKDKGYRLLKELLPEAYDNIVKTRESNSTIGISCGISSIDKAIGGFNNNELIVIGGKTSQGKPAIALDIAMNVAKQNIPVVYFSLEMSCNDIAKRLISKESPAEISNIQYRKFESKKEEGLFWSTVSDGCKRLSKYPIIIDETPAITLNKLQLKIEKCVREYGVQMIIIDYLQLIRGTNPKDRRLEVESITRALKQYAMHYKIPVVALSQLSRGIDHRGEEHRPVLADLRESGSIEQDSDIVMFVHNASAEQKQKYEVNSDEGCENIRELIVRKNRNGECGTVLLYWKAEYASFYGLYDR